MTFCIDFILGFDYFEGLSKKSWVLTILKGSKNKLLCLWTDLADFLTQSSLGDVGRCEISGQITPARPAVKF